MISLQLHRFFLQMQFNLFYLTAFSAKIKEKKEEISKISVNLIPYFFRNTRNLLSI